MVDPFKGTGLDPNYWTCGRVVYENPAQGVIGTCGEKIQWIPYVHVRRGGSGNDDDHILLGGHSMCNGCRLAFKIADIKKFSMWQTIEGQYLAEGRRPPRDRELEIEWLDIEAYLEHVSM